MELVRVTNKTKRKSKSKNSSGSPTKLNLLKGVVGYNYDHSFYVTLEDGNRYTIENPMDLYAQARAYYTTPLNDIYSHWTMVKRIPHLSKYTHKIIKYWSPIKPNLVVYGIIVNNEFKVKTLKGENISWKEK